MVAGWFLPVSQGTIICILSAVTWMQMDLLAGSVYSQNWIPYWNAGVRLGFFSIVLVLLTQLRKHVVYEQHLARTDALTGINNQRAFKNRLASLIRASKRNNQPMVMGYIDLDNFKHINDSMGHSMGDRVLIAVGSELLASARQTDIVGRLGGDEFGILLLNTELSGAVIYFDKLHQSLLDVMNLHAWPIGFSVGVAVFNPAPADEDEAIQAADTLMHTVKSQSKNRVWCQLI